MTCGSCGNKPKKCNKDFTRTVVEIDNPEQITLMRKVTVPASMGDDTTMPPVVGKYHNVLLYYEANHKSYLYSSDGIPTLLANGLTDYEEAVNLPQINGVTLTGNKTSSQLGLQPTLSVAPDTGIKLENNELSGLPATDTTIGMVKPGDGLEVDTDGTISTIKHVFDTVADMEASTDLVNGDYAQTLGYYAVNDGGKAIYKITSATPSGYYETLTSGLYAELIVDGNTNVLQFGIKADGVTDACAKLTAVLALGYTKIYFPSGSYYLSDAVTVPASCKTILGENVHNTTILCGQDGLTLQNVFYTSIKNITIKNNNEDKTHNGITGQLKSALFENVRIQYFDRGLNISGGSWVNTFFKCIFENCNYGIYKDNDGDFNDNNFMRCNISANTYGAYIIASNQNNTFYGCDMESNTHCVMSGGYTTNMNIDNCYCEGDTNIYAIISGFSDRSDVTIQRCRIYQKANSVTGWIAMGRTMSSGTTGKVSPIIIRDNLILFADTTVKPFAFDTSVTESPVSLIVFNIYQNSYAGTAGNNFPSEYFDLIDTTNFPNYCKTGQRSCVSTDLIYKTIDTHFHCMLTNRGIRNGIYRSSNLLHFFGYKEFESTGHANSSFSIPNECGVYQGYSKKFAGIVHYTDESVAPVAVGIDANTISIYNLDSAKTTDYVSLDFYCSGSNSN